MQVVVCLHINKCAFMESVCVNGRLSCMFAYQIKGLTEAEKPPPLLSLSLNHFLTSPKEMFHPGSAHTHTLSRLNEVVMVVWFVYVTVCLIDEWLSFS